MHIPDLTELRLAGVDRRPAGPHAKPAKRPGKRPAFIAGPIPLHWIQRAATLTRKSAAVSLAIWYRAGLTRTTADLVISPRVLAGFGVGRKAGYRCLAAMESA